MRVISAGQRPTSGRLGSVQSDAAAALWCCTRRSRARTFASGSGTCDYAADQGFHLALVRIVCRCHPDSDGTEPEQSLGRAAAKLLGRARSQVWRLGGTGSALTPLPCIRDCPGCDRRSTTSPVTAWISAAIVAVFSAVQPVSRVYVPGVNQRCPRAMLETCGSAGKGRT